MVDTASWHSVMKQGLVDKLPAASCWAEDITGGWLCLWYLGGTFCEFSKVFILRLVVFWIVLKCLTLPKENMMEDVNISTRVRSF